MVAQHEAHVPDSFSGDGESRITVTDISDTATGSASDAYVHAGFDRGYQVAVTETIASLLPATEAFLRENDAPGEVRDALYRFERFLARRLDAVTHPDYWVEGGGGI
jgi:hypothetical protein